MKVIDLFCFLFLSLVTSARAAQCPCGSQYISYFDKCYFFFSSPKSFPNAQQNCDCHSGQLLTIENAFKNSLFVEKASELFSSSQGDFWIRGTGNWTWADGSIFNYSNFDTAESEGDCLAVQINSSKWHSASCFDNKPYICELSVASHCPICAACPPQTSCPVKAKKKPKCTKRSRCPTCPPAHLVCPSEWTYFKATDSCYKTFYSGNWEKAEVSCQLIGGHLTSIHSDEEHDFVSSLSMTSATVVDYPWNAGTWIGLHSVASDILNFTWTDGSPLDYEKYHPGEPNSLDEKCIIMTSDRWAGYPDWYKVWNNVRCDMEIRNYVCKNKAQVTARSPESGK